LINDLEVRLLSGSVQSRSGKGDDFHSGTFLTIASRNVETNMRVAKTQMMIGIVSQAKPMII
jgi:hypothetical protein